MHQHKNKIRTFSKFLPIAILFCAFLLFLNLLSSTISTSLTDEVSAHDLPLQPFHQQGYSLLLPQCTSALIKTHPRDETQAICHYIEIQNTLCILQYVSNPLQRDLVLMMLIEDLTFALKNFHLCCMHLETVHQNVSPLDHLNIQLVLSLPV